MRKHGEWMVHADDRILEFLSEYGNHQPSQIASRFPEIGQDLHYHRKYIGKRCRTLAEHNLLENLGNGVYSITDSGERYLEGELDAAQLDKNAKSEEGANV